MLTFRGEHFYFGECFLSRGEVTQTRTLIAGGFATGEINPDHSRPDENELYILVLASPFTQATEGRPLVAGAIRVAR
jgi:hypothetical protein